MVWTPPATSWVAGFKPPAAWLKAQILDNFRAIGDPWTEFTPSWTAATTNPSLGNGSIAGAYMQAGKLVNFRIRLTIGSTTSVGAGGWSFGRPVTPNPAITWIFPGRAVDASAGAAFEVAMLSAGLLVAAHPSIIGRQTAVADTVPFTWAVGDTFDVSGTYEAA